jgi:branched-chain amino acid transport system ATP-binding protein
MTLLDVDDISMNFRGLAAVRNVSFAIESGSITSIVGPNGAGKSTIFNLISGYLRPTAGNIKLAGQSILSLASHEICKLGIARAFQIAKPFPHFTVRENVLVAASFGRSGPRDPEAVAERCMSICRLDELADEPASALSIGRLRRLELARALSARPRLLLADEPCAGLNETETGTVTDVLKQARDEGVTVLLVEHDIRAVRRISDRVLVIESGAKIADGDAATVFSDPAVIDAYLGVAEP